ncbi:MAG: hypothetical protein ACOYKI_03410 [Sediminibacterium sp.]
MNKEFIPYEQALELKELGFNEECLAYWTKGINVYYIEFDHYANNHWMFTANDNKDRYKMCTAPLYQQVFRWFREKHNLKSCVMFRTSMADNEEYYDSLIKGQEVVYRHFKTYEEAELACLKKLIEIAKNNLTKTNNT